MKKLIKLLKMSDNDVFTHCKKELSKKGLVQTDNENYLYLDMNSSICLVAHLDTVCNNAFKRIMYNDKKIVNRNGILGADDRAGVYAILELLKSFDVSVLITNYEESGGLGVNKFIDDDLLNEINLNLFIELDRRGRNEYVYYNNDLPTPVREYIESFGYKEALGSYSDIKDLTETYLIPSVNLSIGYYNQHTPREVLILNDLKFNIKQVKKMLKEPLNKLYTVAPDVYLAYDKYYNDEVHDLVDQFRYEL